MRFFVRRKRPKNDEKPKISLLKFLYNFCRIFGKLRGLKYWKCSIRTKSLSSRFFRSDNCCFPYEKISESQKLTQKMTKISKLFSFPKFSCNFSQIFDGLCALERWNRSKKKKMCCPVGFSEEFVVVFLLKKSQIDTKMTKTQNFPNFKVFMHFLLEFQQTSWIGMFQRVNRGKLVVQ